MSRSIVRAIRGPRTLFCLAALLAPACADDTLESQCKEGTEGCPCRSDGTCNDGLTCLSKTCVLVPEDEGSSSGDAGSESMSTGGHEQGAAGSSGGNAAVDAGSSRAGTGGRSTGQGTGGAEPLTDAAGIDAVGGSEGVGGSDGAGGFIEATGGKASVAGAAGHDSLPGADQLAPWPGSSELVCDALAQTPAPLPQTFMFVVDVSGSMIQLAPGDERNMWEVTKQALLEWVTELPSTTAVGIVFFPNMPGPGPLPHSEPADDPSACVATDQLVRPAALGASESAARQALASSLENVNVYGGTPTHTACSVGLETLIQDERSTNKYLVLITDGEPTYGAGCVGNGTVLPSNIKPEYISDTLDLIQDASVRTPSISTYVLGLPGTERVYDGSEGRGWLSEAALRGRTAAEGCSSNGDPYCHFDLTAPNDALSSGLDRALHSVLAQTVDCQFELPEPPHGLEREPAEIGVRLTDTHGNAFLVPLSEETRCNRGEPGWIPTHDGAGLTLCPGACQLLGADSAARLDVFYGCFVPGQGGAAGSASGGSSPVLVSSCPTAEPTSGTSCSLPETQLCYYLGGDVSCRCIENLWECESRGLFATGGAD